MKKTIGIPGYKQQDSNGFGVGNHYLNLISKYGNPRIIMPWEEFVDVDMLILPGGMDLNPSAYGEIPSFSTGNQDVFKQFFYDNRLNNYIDHSTIPILGICLGFQQLAAKYGSKITQDLPYHKQSPARFAKGHEAIMTQKAVDILGYTQKAFDINCHHHQGVILNNLSNKLIPLLISTNEEYDDDKISRATTFNPNSIVESFISTDLRVAGIQYHPEEWADSFSDYLINFLLNKNI